MQTIDTLTDEHNGVLTVLQELTRAGTAAAAGTPVPRDIFVDIDEFFRVFVDRCHHHKEEAVLFPALGERAATLRQRLEQEHERGRELARAYAVAVDVYQPGNTASGLVLAAAAEAYTVFLRGHIAVETAELFPMIRFVLTPVDDARITEAFEQIERDDLGPGTHERLHGMIASLAPRIASAA
jgi:hemerythrin-like domain-containing protein